MDSRISSQVSQLKSSLNTYYNELNNIKQVIQANGKGLGLESAIKDIDTTKSEIQKIQSKLSGIN